MVYGPLMLVKGQSVSSGGSLVVSFRGWLVTALKPSGGNRSSSCGPGCVFPENPGSLLTTRLGPVVGCLAF